MCAARDQDTARGQALAAEPARARGPSAFLVAGVLLARFALTIAIAGWLAVLSPALLGLGTTTVMSDSMAPGVVAGDAVVIRPTPAERVRVGDVLLVDDPDRPGRLRLHRLVAVRNGELVLRGDANPTPDSSPVAPAHLRGVAVLRVPLAGLPDYWLRTGAVVPFGLFATLLVALGLVACTDVGASPGGAVWAVRRPRLPTRVGRDRHRVLGTQALVLLVAGTGAVVPSVAAGEGWAIFAGVATSGANTFGASSLFTNCPVRAAGLPAPTVWYGYTAKSGTTETDLAGGHDGIVTGASRQPGYCDGSAASPYLSLTDSSASTVVSQTGGKFNQPSTEFSISLWMNPSNAGTGILADFTDSNGGGSQTMTDRQIYYKTDGTLAFGARFGSGTGTPTTCSTAAPSPGTWHSIVATATTGGVLTLYVDGVQACTVTGASAYAPGGALGGGFWAFGGERALSAAAWGESSTLTGFVGGLDETTVYSSALTQTDVTNLFNAGH